MSVALRDMVDSDVLRIATIWHEGWHRAHAAHVPDALVRLRSFQSLKDRLEKLAQTANHSLRVAGPPGQPLGFCITRCDELYQIYVSPDAEGRGIARALLEDGEQQIRHGGHPGVWLICLPENTRARRFYRRAGWQEDGLQTSELETPEGPFPVTTLMLRKPLI